MEFNLYIDKYKNDIVKNIQNLVRIPSVEGEKKENMPFGEGPHRALEYVLNLGQKLGFETKNFDNYAGHIEYGQGDKIIGVLCHVDVVAVGSGWTKEPFGGDIEDGKIYGRGSYDDKGACISSIYALNAIKESGINLNKKIRVIFGANEETGMNDIPYYLSREKEPYVAFSPDSPFPMIHGEKGIIDISLNCKIQNISKIKKLYGGTQPKFVPEECVLIVQVVEEQKNFLVKYLQEFSVQYENEYEYDKSKQEMKIKIQGKQGSGSTPENGKNAISGMMKLLYIVDFLKDEINEFVNLYNEKIGQETDGKSVECNFTDDISTPLTLNVGTIELKDNNLEIKIHIRYPIMSNSNDIFENLKKNLNTNISQIIETRHLPSHYVPKDDHLVDILMKVYREETGQYDAQPTTMAGGTYARTMKNAVAFGPLFPGEPQVAHGADEYVNIDSIIKATKIYAKAIYELSK